MPARGGVLLGRGGALFGHVATPSGDRTFDARFSASAASREVAAAIWGGDIGGSSVTLRADGALSGAALVTALRAADRLAVRLAQGHPGGDRDRS